MAGRRRVARPEMAVVLARMLRITAGLTLRLVRPRARIRALALLMEEIEPVWTNPTKHGPIEFYCPATWPYTRSDMAKEPATLEWIDGFAQDDVFWDVGANVGVFTLYAARRGLNVCAFEPAAVNFYVLARNVALNGFDGRVTFLNVALAERSQLSTLYMSHTRVGGAQHQFGRPQDDETHIKRDSYGRANTFRQSTLGFSVDDLIGSWGLPFPNHIKIDVDGNEVEIVRGAAKTLSDSRLRSVLIEIRADAREDRIRQDLANAGLVQTSQHGMNHVFVRQDAG